MGLAKFFVLAALPLVLVSGTGCSSDAEEDEVGAGDQAATVDLMPGTVKGDYVLESADFETTLKIRSIIPFAFDLKVVPRKGGFESGGFIRSYATLVGDTATFNGQGDCQIVLKRSGDAFDLKQTGNCEQELAYGSVVGPSGTYKRKVWPRNSISDPAVEGYYNIESATLTGKLTIWSTDPFSFALDVRSRANPRNFAMIAAEYATPVDSVATFKGAGDCEIAIERDGNALTLKQTGTCQQEFFQIDASGKYFR